jgi:DNA-binding transcriptional regulator YiaG
MARPAHDLNKLKKSKNTSLPLSIKDMPESHERYQAELISQFIIRRQELEISQRQLGETIGITDYLLAKWERGHRRPTGFLLWCWAEALGIKLIIKRV